MLHALGGLSAGGFDSPENVACVCPAHHREIHHGRDGEHLNQALRQLRKNELLILSGEGRERSLA